MADWRRICIQRRLVGAFLSLTIFPAAVLSQKPTRASIRVPPAYETWALTGGCVMAELLFTSATESEQQALAQTDTVDWIFYSGVKQVEVLRREEHDDCALVRLLDSGKSGWIATSLLGPSAEQAARISAARKAEQKAEQERQAAINRLPTLESGFPGIFVASDRKCSEQFVQALSMEGLEKRKRLADLVSYGCGFIEDRGVHATRVQTEGSYCLVKLASGKHPNQVGWVPCSWVK